LKDIEYWNIPKGTHLLIATRLYLIFLNKAQTIPNITGSVSEDWWTLKNDILEKQINHLTTFSYLNSHGWNVQRIKKRKILSKGIGRIKNDYSFNE
jgi:hypothetical protein